MFRFIRLQGVRSCSAHLKKPDRLAKLCYLSTLGKKWPGRTQKPRRSHTFWPRSPTGAPVLRRVAAVDPGASLPFLVASSGRVGSQHFRDTRVLSQVDRLSLNFAVVRHPTGAVHLHLQEANGLGASVGLTPDGRGTSRDVRRLVMRKGHQLKYLVGEKIAK